MKIASIKRTSLLDYPGKIAAIIGTQGCNMRCPWCHNAYLIPYEFSKSATVIEPIDFFDFLEQRKNLLDAVVITGGEPTIHNDLPDFCQQVKTMGYRLKLDTNGTNPAMLKQLINDDLVDYVAMDIKTDSNRYPELFREPIEPKVIADSAELLLSAKKMVEFRTTCVQPYVSMENISRIALQIQGATQHYLQKCTPAPFHARNGEYEITTDEELIYLQKEMEKVVSKCEIRS